MRGPGAAGERGLGGGRDAGGGQALQRAPAGERRRVRDERDDEAGAA